MSIEKNFEVRETGMKYLDEFRKETYHVSSHVSYDVMGDSYSRDYLLSLTASVKFRASAQTYKSALNNAKRMLHAKIFSEIVDLLPELQLAIYNGDRDAALAIYDRLHAAATGDTE